MTLTLARPIDARPWVAVTGIWLAAVVLSTIQIYLREVAYGSPPPWFIVLWANCLAWSPWLAIAPSALFLERRFPISGRGGSVRVVFHAAIACAVSAVFLLYLALFHWVYLEELPVGGNLVAIRDAYLRKLDQFFLTAVLLYGTILLVGFAKRVLGEARARRQTPGVRSEATPAPLIVRSVGRVERVDPPSVDWIEGCGNYARLHVNGRSKLIRRTLASLASELAPSRFVRVHRSAIVNLERVVEMRRLSHGEAQLFLKSGHRLKVSRTYRRALEHLTR